MRSKSRRQPARVAFHASMRPANVAERMTERPRPPPRPAAETAAADDPYLWLEEIDSAQVRAWVEARNAETMSALCDAQFEEDRAAVLDIFNAADRIPWIQQRGQFVYNFWQDAEHRKGLWRRTTLASYRSENPDWETMLDIDLLARRKPKTGSGAAARRCRPSIGVGSFSSRAAAPTPP